MECNSLVWLEMYDDISIQHYAKVGHGLGNKNEINNCVTRADDLMNMQIKYQLCNV